MATPFRLKRSAIEGKRPAESDLQRGELALNTYDGYLYTEREGVGLSTVTNLTPWYENYGGGSIYYSNSVGIGTTVPQYKLDVRKGSIGGYDDLRAPHSDVIVEIEVTVANKTDDHRYQGSGSNSAYVLDGIQSPFLTLTPGRTYRFKQDDNSNSSHPLRFYLEADKTTQYTTNVTTNGTAGSSGAYTQIVVSDETPVVLHYQCSAHGYMGNAIANNSNVVNTNYAATIRNSLDVSGSIAGFDDLRAPHSDTVKTYTVTVASKDSSHRYQGQGSGNGYLIDGIFSPFLTLTPGRTYKFDQSDGSNSGHPLRFYLEADKTTQYSTNVTTNGSAGSSGAYTQIVVSDETPTVLHYQCTAHGYMGNAVQVNSNVVNSNYAATLRGGLNVSGGESILSSATVSDLTSGRVVLAGGSGALQDSGNLLFNGTDLSTASLIVSDLTSGRVVLAGGSGAVEDNANLKFNTTTSEFEVVGHTILDSITASGISTFQNNVHLLDDDKLLIGTGEDLEIYHESSTGKSILKESGASGFHFQGSNIVFDNTAGNKRYLNMVDGGAVELFHNTAPGGTAKLVTTSTGVTINGNLSAVDGAFSGDLTVTGNVGIAGTLTYEDVSRVDAVGLSTFREGLFIPDNQKAQFGNVAGSADLELFHNGTNSHIRNNTGALVLNADSLLLQSLSENYLSATANGAVKLFFDNANKLETSAKGIKVGTGVTIETNGQATFAGVVTATKFVGDGSDLTGIDASALKFGGVVKAQANGFGVVVTGVTTSSGGFSGNLTGNVTGNVTGTASLATDLAINGTNQIVYQDSNNDSDVLPTGTAGQILASSGAGAAPQWVNSAPAGAIEGITIRDESSIVGTANSISTINFIGSVVTADAAVGSGIATVTVNAIAGLGISEGSGSKATGATGLDFVGPLIGVDASSNTGISTVRVDALTIKDEGSTVGTAGSITTINFVGSGIAAAVSGDTATVTSAGGATTDDIVALAIALG